MNRRHFLHQFSVLAALAFTGSGCASAAGDDKLGTIQRPRSYWKPLLPPAAYAVLFEEDTEPSHSSPLLEEHRAGTFICAACAQPLFESGKKFESGTGWPSFWQPMAGAVATKSDRKFFMERTEYHCSRCGGHQGHVFDDGPAPTGKRYCNNGLALGFVAQGATLPQLKG